LSKDLLILLPEENIEGLDEDKVKENGLRNELYKWFKQFEKG
jgi:hypothetical protein